MEKCNETEPLYNVEIVDDYNELALEDILRLEKECFPEDWQYDDAKEYYKEMLEDKDNINIFFTEDGKRVGYLLARPHDKTVEGLKDADPLITEQPGYYYLETIELLPDYQGKGRAWKLIEKMCEEAKRKGAKNFSVHARTSNGFSDKLKQIFKDGIIKTRKISEWSYGGNEPYEYIEWKTE